MKVLVFNSQRCDGCRLCEATCSQTWFKEANAEKSAIRISESEEQPGHYQAIFCNQCGECIDICPSLALTRDKHGIVRLNKKQCTGCLSCVGFCPILAMYIHPDYVVPFKCVACGECAKACPTGALSIEDLPEASLTETEKRMKVVAK